MKGRSEADKLIAELDALLGPGPARASTIPAKASKPPPAVEPPAVEPAAVQPAPAVAKAAPQPKGPAWKVLLVEDDKDFRKIVRFLLSENGYRVMEAKDGREGLRLACQDPPDLAMVDFEMPGLNGYELIQELRARDETRKIPLIMVTGAPHRAQLRALGMDVADFLDKPVKNEELLAAVARVFAGRKPAEQSVTGNGGAKPAAALAPEPEPAPAPEPAPEPEPEVSLDLPDNGEGEEALLIEDQKKEQEEEQLAGLDVLANDSPLVNRINRILVHAVTMGASDIHIEPQEKSLGVRVRVNGSLRPLCRLPSALAPQVAARIKIMSNLVITERRRPQDGQVRAMIKGRKVEFRVSTIPSIYGEKIVMRVLGGAKIKAGLAELGFSERDLLVVQRAVESPHGLLLVTGPTGSGKTTTLYTILRLLNEPDVNIMTAEDPVEYELAGITQVQVKAHIGLTFESILRSFLRQDPDIMLVGEIRDLETAEIAVKAAITGHLVLSTLHTNSAPAAVMRMTNMGVAPFLLADSVKMIAAQRLVKTLCPSCRVEKPLPDNIKRLIGEEEAARLPKVMEANPAGCKGCGQSGYTGRMPIFEVMDVRSTQMRQLVTASSGATAIGELAVKEGMKPLHKAVLDVVAGGRTSVEEALSIMLAQ